MHVPPGNYPAHENLLDIPHLNVSPINKFVKFLILQSGSWVGDSKYNKTSQSQIEKEKALPKLVGFWCTVIHWVEGLKVQKIKRLKGRRIGDPVVKVMDSQYIVLGYSAYHGIGLLCISLNQKINSTRMK